jgi:uncharacterized membrane protein
MRSYSVLDVNRNQLGPISEEEVRELFRKGTITLDSLGWTPGMSEWQPLRSFSEFIDVPNSPTAPIPDTPPPMSNVYDASGAKNPYAPPASGTSSPLNNSRERAHSLTAEVLARDYHLGPINCISRGFKLVFSPDFWPIFGVTLLVYLVLTATSVCYISFVIGGPLLGGLSLYFLKKVRGQPADLSTAFSGFSLGFLHLFLCFLVMSAVTALGLLALVLPGIYLAVAYTFATTLVIDKNLEFWDAMECSRKVISRHWFSFFGLLLLLTLLSLAGALALCIGMLLVLPVYSAALAYAYEDVFHPGGQPLGQGQNTNSWQT